MVTTGDGVSVLNNVWKTNDVANEVLKTLSPHSRRQESGQITVLSGAGAGRRKPH